MRFIKENINIDFLGKKKMAVTISSVLILIGLIAFVYRGQGNLGIDFSGGLITQVEFNQDVNIEQLRAALKINNLQDAPIQQISENKRMFIVRAPHDAKALVIKSLQDGLPGINFNIIREEMVGPLVGKDLSKKGIMAIIISLLGILLYVSLRFEFRYALGAVVALFHDVLITMGALALTGKDLSLSVLAALLTIVGYSLNDTIVIFDRVRETVRFNKKDSLEVIINKSLNQTLSRTILTSTTTFFVVVALFFWGGEVIHDFAFAMLVGIVTGTYSTVYIASPVLLMWKKPS